MIRVCPKRDAICPHGIECPYVVDRYTCKEEPPITPQRQFAESVKYTPRPVVLIPTDAGFVIMEAYGPNRDYICEVRPDELAQWVRGDFTARRAERQTPTRPAPDLQMNLNDLELNLDNL